MNIPTRIVSLLGGLLIGVGHGPAHSQVRYANGLFSATAPFQLDPNWSCHEPPPMPAAALRAGTTGTVDIELRVDPDGSLASAAVTKSSGDTREHKLLDRVSLHHVIQCRRSLDPSKPVQTVKLKWMLN